MGAGSWLAKPVMPTPGVTLLTAGPGGALLLLRQGRKRGTVFSEVACLPPGVYHHVADNAICIDDERSPKSHAAVFVENAILAGYFPVGPEVRQKIKPVALFFGVGAQGKLTVHGDGEHCSVSVVKGPDIVPELTEFTGARTMLEAMAEALTAAEHDLESARVVALQAHARWQADKSAVRAIEHLLDERARARLEEAVRAESREIDDIVSRLHLRQSIRRRSTHRGVA